MGVFDRLFGKKEQRKAVRGKSRPIDERLKEEELRQLRKLQQEDPMLARAYWMRRLGLDRSEDKLDSALQVIQKLQERGLIPESPEKLSGDTWLREIGRGIAAGLGPALAMVFQQAAMQQMQQQGQQAYPGMPWPPMQYSPAPPSSQPAPELAPAPPQQTLNQPTSAQSASTSPTDGGQQEQEEISEASQRLIALLDGKTPDEAVQLIMSFPQTQMFGRGLLMVPEEQLLAHLYTLEKSIPDLAGFVAWLRQRPEWLLAVVRGLRAKFEK